MIESYALCFLAMVWFHLLLDYALQGEFMAKAKNPNSEDFGAPWKIVLSSHAFLQAVPVGLITGSWIAMILELFSHFTIDYFKCQKYLSFTQDQALHVICKAIWVGFMILGIP